MNYSFINYKSALWIWLATVYVPLVFVWYHGNFWAGLLAVSIGATSAFLFVFVFRFCRWLRRMQLKGDIRPEDDPYKVLAALVYSTNPHFVSKEQRRVGKNMAFGMKYGVKASFDLLDRAVVQHKRNQRPLP